MAWHQEIWLPFDRAANGHAPDQPSLAHRRDTSRSHGTCRNSHKRFFIDAAIKYFIPWDERAPRRARPSAPCPLAGRCLRRAPHACSVRNPLSDARLCGHRRRLATLRPGNGCGCGWLDVLATPHAPTLLDGMVVFSLTPTANLHFFPSVPTSRRSRGPRNRAYCRLYTRALPAMVRVAYRVGRSCTPRTCRCCWLCAPPPPHAPAAAAVTWLLPRGDQGGRGCAG